MIFYYYCSFLIFVLPTVGSSKCFGTEAHNFFRVVLSGPEEKLKEGYTRISEFCTRHHK
jgi:hypothetical protein